MRILLIEDEKKLSENIKKGLLEQGFAVDQAYDGSEGLFLAESESYDLIILDVMLPIKDGIEISTHLRKTGKTIPILMLTARSRTEDKVAGLNAGADDYLSKPFEFSELLARIHALLRRSYRQPTSQIRIADLEVDPLSHTAKRSSKKLMLTPKEFSILELLARNKDQVVTRTQIIEHTWDYQFDSLSNIVDVFIATLRKKIDAGHTHKLLHTIHGVGYKLTESSP